VARNFNGTGVVNASIPAATAAALANGITLIGLIRATSVASTAWPLSLMNAGNTEMAALRYTSTTLTYRANGVVYSPAANVVIPTTAWALIAATKPAGTSAPRLHLYNYSTDTWTRSTSASTAPDPSSDCTTVQLGENTGFSAGLVGDAAAFAVYASALADSQLDSLPYNLQAWMSLAPLAMWVLDQPATSQKVLDWTGNGANETSLTGTTVGTVSVPILSYGHPVILGTHAVAGAGGTTYSATGTVAGVGAASGSLTLARAVAGTAAGAGAASGTLSVAMALSGTAAGVGADTGTETLSIPLTGTAAGVGAASGAETLSIPLSGTVAGAGTTAGAEFLSIPLAGTAAGVGATAGDAQNGAVSTGTVAGAGTTAGVGFLSIPLAGTAAGAGAASGVLSRTVTAAGAAAGAGTAAGTLTQALALAGAAAGVGTADGELSGVQVRASSTLGVSARRTSTPHILAKRTSSPDLN
jgi:hypothetical protein